MTKETLFLGTPKLTAVPVRPIAKAVPKPAFEPLPTPPVTYSTRPDAFTLMEHLLPALLMIERPLAVEAFTETLNRLTDTPMGWMNAFLFHPRATNPFVAVRIGGKRPLFMDGSAMPMTGATAIRYVNTGTRRDMAALRRIETVPHLGDGLIIVREPADQEWKDCHLIQWWQLSEEKRVLYGLEPFRSGTMHPAIPASIPAPSDDPEVPSDPEIPGVLDSPEAKIPFAMTRPTFAVLLQKP